MSMLLPGPYTSVQTLPCDLSGVLECPTYWRNDDGTRSFPMCDTAALYKDQQLPFTCGSQLRRSLIKYFYRDYCPVFRGSGLRSTVGLLVKQNVDVLRAGWTNPHNFACRDAATGLCTFAACDEGAMFEPCLDMAPFNVPIDAPTGQESVLTEWLSSAVKYYPFAMQDPRPWTTYYKASAAPGQASLPAQWGHSSASALAAAHELLFTPSAPVLTHGPDEAYSMPSGKGLTPTQLLEGSPWALCMAVVAQPWSTMPVGANGSAVGWEALVGVDWTDLEAVEASVGRLMAAAIARSPLVWHRGRRHAPTPSAVCAGAPPSPAAHARIYVGGVDVYLERLSTAPVTVNLAPAPGGASFAHRGFSWGLIGAPTCLCAENHPTLADRCLVDVATLCPFAASTDAASCGVLRAACSQTGGAYPRTADAIGAMFACLHNETAAGVRCPELAPSDAWGLYPVDCGDAPCDVASGWMGGGTDVLYPGTLFGLSDAPPKEPPLTPHHDHMSRVAAAARGARRAVAVQLPARERHVQRVHALRCGLCPRRRAPAALLPPARWARRRRRRANR